VSDSGGGPTRHNVSSNSPYEPLVGFSRAVRAGNLVFVSGTAAWGPDGRIVEGGVYEQARRCIANIEAALVAAGSGLADVVRTRIYIVDMAAQDEVARAHREAFGGILPASTLVEVGRLASPQMLVELEADAVVSSEANSA
jgi:enamine deaminase RidA (YjgF/YER057c/UK114 family)